LPGARSVRWRARPVRWGRAMHGDLRKRRPGPWRLSWVNQGKSDDLLRLALPPHGRHWTRCRPGYGACRPPPASRRCKSW